MRSLRLASIVAALSLDAACAPGPVTPVAVQVAPSGCVDSPAISHAAGPSTATAVAAPSTSVATAVAPSSPETTQAPPPGFQEALDGASRAIATSDFVSADKHIEAAGAIAGDDAHLAYLVARLRTTRFVYTGDFEHAAAALVALIPVLARHPELADEFWSHNTMMMIREAQGDPAAALAEDDQATLCATRGIWDPAASRDARLPEGPLASRLPHADACGVAYGFREGGARAVRAGGAR